MEPDSFDQTCAQAVRLAANDLGLDEAALADELAQGEIGLLVRYLRRALPHVPGVEEREEMALLLHRLTAWTGRAGG